MRSDRPYRKGRSKADAPQIDGAVYLSSRRPLRVGEIVTAKIERAEPIRSAWQRRRVLSWTTDRPLSLPATNANRCARNDVELGYGLKIDAPVVARLSRSICAFAASFSA